MFYPSVFSYQSAQDYFQDFYSQNKRETAGFSFGHFSKKLNWPRSYLSDVIGGRQAVSVSRALEFAKYFEFSHLETEKLVLLCIHANMPDVTKDACADWFQSEYSRAKEDHEKHRKDSMAGDSMAGQSKLSAKSIAVVAVLSWWGGRSPLHSSEIESLLPTFDFANGETDRIIAELLDKGVVEYRNDVLSVRRFLDIDDRWFFLSDEDSRKPEQDRLQTHKDFLSSTSAFIDDFRGFSTLDSGFVVIEEDQFLDIQDLFIKTVRHIKQVSQKNLCKQNYDPKRHRIFQFDMNFFSAFTSDLRQLVLKSHSHD